VCPWKVPAKRQDYQYCRVPVFLPSGASRTCSGHKEYQQKELDVRCQCSPVMALGWLANTDLQPAVIYKGLILYVAKYVSKPEIKSASYQELQDQV
jgi:hypothetical protein